MNIIARIAVTKQGNVFGNAVADADAVCRQLRLNDGRQRCASASNTKVEEFGKHTRTVEQRVIGSAQFDDRQITQHNA